MPRDESVAEHQSAYRELTFRFGRGHADLPGLQRI